MTTSFLLRAAVAALLGSLTSTMAAALPPQLSQQTNVLKPVNVDLFEQTAGLRVRSSNDFSRLSLEDQAQMVFGSKGGESSSHTRGCREDFTDHVALQRTDRCSSPT